jgi:hypothetical protein
MNIEKTVLATLLMTLAVAFFSGSSAAQGGPCSQCGPGDHWVDQCASGQDVIADQGAAVGMDLDRDPFCLADVNLALGPCSAPEDLLIIRRSGPLDDSQNFPGLRPLDGHLDVIDTEIISMCLTGSGVTLRAGAGLGPGSLRASLGAISEQPGDPEWADSFFDVFVEVNLGDTVLLYNQTPLRLDADINCVPPKVSYIHPVTCLPLYTSPLYGQGTHVANLVTAEHHVFPDTAVAIELSSFTATGYDGYVTLTWETASEVNTHSFNIYRDREKIASVPAAGDAHDYIYVDRKVSNGVSYTYQLSDVDLDGHETMHEIICAATPEAKPSACALAQNYPNPFNPSTEISYALPVDAHVTLTVYNLLGQEIVTLVDGERSAGRHTVSWTATGHASGIYFYRLHTDDFSTTRKMVFMK